MNDVLSEEVKHYDVKLSVEQVEDIVAKARKLYVIVGAALGATSMAAFLAIVLTIAEALS